ncbi:MAG: hypothetical protein V2I67_00650 [Thermoanaerobaculales bacterium]|jgi:hypothetical protein|nr:hypothetical protein [Thermoanaerobaculales bacterium]
MSDMTDDPLDEIFDDDVAAAEDDLDDTGASRIIDADSILDSLVPGNIDWKDTVRRHPAASVLGVGLVGYLVGRTKGATIMTGLTAALSAAMMRQLSDVFEGDFFDY